jgi:hypothetical protein
VLNKLLHAAAVLALLTGTTAVAQIGGRVGGSVSGQVGGQVSGQVNRGFSANAGVRGGGGGGKSQGSASSWAPARGSGGSEQSAGKAAAGMERAGHEESLSPSPSEHKSGVAKQGAMKKIGSPAGMAGGSSFGGSKGTSVQFGFSGRLPSGGGSGGSERERTEAAKFAKSMAGHGGSSGRGHGKSSGKRVLPKLREPQGEQDCDNASSLHLCTWL